MQTKAYLIQLGSHGVDIISQLQTSHREDPSMARFFALIDDTLVSIVDYLPEASEFIDVDAPFESLCQYALDIDTSNSIANLTLVVIYHCWLLTSIEQSDIDLRKFVSQSKGIIGHSVGLITSLFLSHYSHTVQLEDLVSCMVKYIFMLTFRSHLRYQNATSTVDNHRIFRPMVSVKGLAHDTLNQHINTVKAQNPQGALLEIGLKNTDQINIVVGQGQLIETFSKQLINDAIVSVDDVSPLDFSAPYHCTFLSGIQDDFTPDLDFIGFNFDLNFPVTNLISTLDGRNLSLTTNLALTVADLVCGDTVDWELTLMSALTNQEVEVIYDFGPGPLVKLFTQTALRKQGLSIRQLSLNKNNITQVLKPETTYDNTVTQP